MKRVAVLIGALLSLMLSASAAQAHVVALTVDQDATLSAGRTIVTARGMLSCTEGEQFFLNVDVIQGEAVTQTTGFGGFSGTCSGSPQSWEVTVSAYGTFHPGMASARVRMGTFGLDGFDDELIDRLVTLRF